MTKLGSVQYSKASAIFVRRRLPSERSDARDGRAEHRIERPGLSQSARDARRPSGPAATMLAGSEDHASALLGGGEVWCWGANTNGEPGDRTTLTRR